MVPPEPKAADEHLADVAHVHLTAGALLEVLHRMPWTRDHRPECPASCAGPCTCGVADLVTATEHLRELLDA